MLFKIFANIGTLVKIGKDVQAVIKDGPSKQEIIALLKDATMVLVIFGLPSDLQNLIIQAIESLEKEL